MPGGLYGPGIMQNVLEQFLIGCVAVLSLVDIVSAAGSGEADHILICKERTLFRVPADPIPSIRAPQIFTHSRVGGNETDILWKPHMPPLDARSFAIL